MGAGRPTEYKPEYCEQVTKLCKLGATDKEIAEFFGVCETTIQNWKNDHPEFLASIREGRIVADMEVAESLHEKAKGGDVPAARFWLMNRQRAKWTERSEVESTNKNLNVNADSGELTEDGATRVMAIFDAARERRSSQNSGEPTS